MAVIDDTIKEVIDSNRAKAHEKAKKDQVAMRSEVKEYIENCSILNLQKIFSFVKEIKRKHVL